MSATRRNRQQKPPSTGLTVLLLNLPALIGLSVIGILYGTGRIQIQEIPGGTVQSLLVAGAAIVLLFLVAGFSLPVSHQAARHLERALARRRAVLRGQIEGSRVGAVVTYPFVGLAWIPTALVRFVLIVLALGLIAVFIVFTIRAFRPEFLGEQLQWVLERL